MTSREVRLVPQRAGRASSAESDCSQRRPGPRSRPPAYASKRLNTATAFWPPNPKPLTMAVSTVARRAALGT
jgi:hypothetical protein